MGQIDKTVGQIDWNTIEKPKTAHKMNRTAGQKKQTTSQNDHNARQIVQTASKIDYIDVQSVISGNRVASKPESWKKFDLTDYF